MYQEPIVLHKISPVGRHTKLEKRGIFLLLILKYWRKLKLKQIQFSKQEAQYCLAFCTVASPLHSSVSAAAFHAWLITLLNVHKVLKLQVSSPFNSAPAECNYTAGQ